MSEQSFNQPLQDEISLKDIIDFLLESWRAIAVSGILGGLLATGYAFITPPKYVVSASIQVAKVAGSDVEAPSVLVEKLKMPTYYSTESYSACNVMDTIDPGEVIAKSLNPILSKSAHIISFSYIDEDSENAKKCILSILNDVRKNQNLVFKSNFEIKKNHLAQLKQKLDDSERIVKALPDANSSSDFSDINISVVALILANIPNKKNEIKDLRSQINNLEVLLSEPQTSEAILVAPIHAPKQKVSPKRTLILMRGLTAGLFLGLFFMIGKRSWHAYKTSDQ